MDDMMLGLFLGEIEKQANYALSAATQMTDELSQTPLDGSRLFSNIQAFLGATGNVSKILWTAARRGATPDERAHRAKCEARGEELRRLLGVQESSILRERHLRDHFEHFEERLQTIADLRGGRIVMDGNISIGQQLDQAFVIPQMPTEGVLRNFESPPPTVVFYERKYELQPIVDALVSLVGSVQQVKAAKRIA